MKYLLYINSLATTAFDISKDIHKGIVSEISEKIDVKNFAYTYAYINLKICDIDSQNVLNTSNYYSVFKHNLCFLEITTDSDEILFRGKIDENSLSREVTDSKPFTIIRVISYIDNLANQMLCLPVKQNQTIKDTIEFILNRPYGEKVGKYASDGVIHTVGTTNTLHLVKTANDSFLELTEITYVPMYLILQEEIIQITNIVLHTDSVDVIFETSNRQLYTTDAYVYVTPVEVDDTIDVYIVKELENVNYITEAVADQSKLGFVELSAIEDAIIIESHTSGTDVDFATKPLFALTKTTDPYNSELYVLSSLNESTIFEKNCGKIWTDNDYPNHRLTKIYPCVEGFFQSASTVCFMTYGEFMIPNQTQYFPAFAFWVYDTDTDEFTVEGVPVYSGSNLYTPTATEIAKKAIMNTNHTGLPYVINGIVCVKDCVMLGDTDTSTYSVTTDNFIEYVYNDKTNSTITVFKWFPIFWDNTDYKYYFIRYDSDGSYISALRNMVDLTSIETEILDAISDNNWTKLADGEIYLGKTLQYRTDLFANTYSKILYEKTINGITSYYFHFSHTSNTWTYVKNEDIDLEQMESFVGYNSGYTDTTKWVYLSDLFKIESDNKSKTYIINNFRKLILSCMYYNVSDNKIHIIDLNNVFRDFSSTKTIEKEYYEIVSVSKTTTEEITESYLSEIQDFPIKYKLKQKLQKLYKGKEWTVITISTSYDTIFRLFDKYYLETYDDTYQAICLGTTYKLNKLNEYQFLIGTPSTIKSYTYMGAI